MESTSQVTTRQPSAMDWQYILQYATTLAAVLSVASVIRQRDTIRTLNENNSALKERVVILEDETKTCLASHKENEKKIAALQAELTAYKELSLVPKELITELISYDKAILDKLERKK